MLENSNLPVVVDFWAEWCAPCRMLSPVLEEIADEFGDKIRVVTVNVDDQPSLASHYVVTSVPTLLVFIDGKIVKTVVGGRPKSMLLRDLSEYLT